MKLDIKCLLLIFITLTCNLIDTHSKIRKARRTSVRANYLQHLKDAISNPKNLFNFILGILSKFYPVIHEKYKKFSEFYEKVEECFETANLIKEKLTHKDEHTLELVKEFPEKPKERLEFCKNVKKGIEENTLRNKAFFERYQTRSIFDGIFEMISPVDKCNYNLDKNLSSQKVEEWLKECKYFLDLDCDNFANENKISPTSAVLEILKTGQEYFESIMNIKNCLVNVGKKAFKGNDLWETFNKEVENLRNQGLGLLLNIVTFGIWGGIKGAKAIIDFGKDISEHFEKKRSEYYLGRLLGQAIIIFKSFVAGRRKKF